MKRCLVIRWGAYGDIMYALPAIEELAKEHEYIHLETTVQGKILLQYHPAIRRLTVFEFLAWPRERHHEVAQLRWNTLEQMEWDKSVNFWRCLEVSCIPEEHQTEFFYPRERRRALYGGKSFYDEHFKKAGLPVPEPFNRGSLYFTEPELDWALSFANRHGERLKIAISLCGSTGQKVPFGLKQLAERILAEFPDAFFILLGNKEAEQLAFSFGKKNVMLAYGSLSYMQSALMTKVADYVIGPETSLLVAAGLFGTPKTMICTSSGVGQAVKYHPNDFSVQSTYPCSPCHRAIYNYLGKASQRFCNTEDSWLGPVPGCNIYYPTDRILEGVRFANEMRGVRRAHDVVVWGPEGVGRFAPLPELSTLQLGGADRRGEVQ